MIVRVSYNGFIIGVFQTSDHSSILCTRTSRERYMSIEEFCFSQTINTTTVKTCILPLWPDIDVMIKQEVIQDGKVFQTMTVDLTLSQVERFIELIKKAYEQSNELEQDWLQPH